METSTVAKQLEALGSETRLAIYQYLCEKGNAGLNVGEIREMMSIPASTLSHHINKLVSCGLVMRRRQGTAFICTPEQAQMDALVMYLADNCCGEDSAVWG